MTLDYWRGNGGDDYTRRNQPTPARMKALHELWEDIFSHLPPVDTAVEIGAGTGDNLRALWPFVPGPVFGVEPNDMARRQLENVAFAGNGSATDTGLPDDFADLAFTSACLIHVPPNQLSKACAEIHRIAKRYIVCIEYFSHEPQEIPYRDSFIWKRDFGGFWLDQFNLMPLGCGFAWKRTTGLDDLTWWAFEKPAQSKE